jgi:hypothetical protein
VRILEGLLGDSDKEGYKRLYFNRELDHYAEFRAEDVIFREPIPSEQPPFFGLDATRVGIRRDATIEFTRVRTPRPVDEFDLDVRLAAPGGLRAEEERFDCTRRRTGCPPPDVTDGGEFTCQGNTCQGNTCQGNTCHGDFTCVGRTCFGQTCAGRTCPGGPFCPPHPTEGGELTCHFNTCGGNTCLFNTCQGNTCQFRTCPVGCG